MSYFFYYSMNAPSFNKDILFFLFELPISGKNGAFTLPKRLFTNFWTQSAQNMVCCTCVETHTVLY